MRILLIVDGYFPERRSQAKLIHDLAIELRDRDNDVAILAPSEEARAPLVVSTEEGVTVLRVFAKGLRNVPRSVRAFR